MNSFSVFSDFLFLAWRVRCFIWQPILKCY